MPPTPYRSAAEHLRDHLALAQVLLASAARRRQLEDVERWYDDAALAELHAALARDEATIAAREARSDPARLPLARLRACFALSSTELRVLAVLCGLELDLGLRAQVRAFTSDARRPEPDVGLLAELLYATPAERARIPEELGPDGRLARSALVAIDHDPARAFVLRPARATARILELVHGRDALEPDLARRCELWPAQARPGLVRPAVADELAGLVDALITASARGVAHPVVLVTGPDGAGRKTLLADAIAGRGLATLRVRVAALPTDERALRELGARLRREAAWWGAAVLLDGVDQQAAVGAHQLDELLFDDAPLAIVATAGRITGRPPRLGRGAVVIELGVPGEAAREQLWRRALPAAADGEVARWAAERYAVTPGVITAAAAAATARAEARADALMATDVHDGLRGVLDAKLATLGMRITWRQTWDDLVLPDDAVAEVREFIARVRHRRLVYDRWGFGRKVAKGLGLSALFAGPPGTGKTMVAGLIAEALRLDLYQVDLSKVVSKWVGETEKNLGELFDAAEAGHAILLFDEADSLFAKRTQVQSSNDRYANLEVNYLLQRMEAFAGIVILTTNHDAAIDEAFRRRLSLRVDFPVPEPDERERLWRTLLPAEAALGADIDYATLADRFEMTGGYIKNAALRAAFLAADEDGPIAMRHLERAARAEYQAMGKVVAQ
ncbi:MAG: ATP-binding protein [Myxococcales bacterium]|nr:ATP-binding protein [Myxococcales bacterium]MBK7192614.1 ATP-binding protein [Myxococcales bacterium]